MIEISMKICPRPVSLLRFQLLAPAILLTLFSCSTLVGNVKPVDEKSKDYWVMNLAEGHSFWNRLDSRAVAEAGGAMDPKNDAFSSEVSDVAFQSRKTAAIISLNSACRKGREAIDLQAFSNELTMGLQPSAEAEEQELRVSGQKALQTTVEGTIYGEETRIRTVVLQKGPCVYDLMYIAKPDRFRTHEADFSRFVSSLKVR